MLSQKFNPRGPAHVLVTDWLDRTPWLRFLGRAGNVSDPEGQKLVARIETSPAKHVLRIGRKLLAELTSRPI
jgi:hypothetical protein